MQITQLPSISVISARRSRSTRKSPRYLKVVWGVGYKDRETVRRVRWQKKTNFIFKRLVGFLHFLFACVPRRNRVHVFKQQLRPGVSTGSRRRPLNSPRISAKVQADITNIFDYVQYQDIFESNGEVDYSQVVLEVTTGPGGKKNPTLWTILSSTENPWATTWTSPTTTR